MLRSHPQLRAAPVLNTIFHCAPGCASLAAASGLPRETFMRIHAAIIALVFGLMVPLFAGAQTSSVTPETRAAAKELIATMRVADQFKQLFPAIMSQLKPAIVQGRAEVERDYDQAMAVVLEAMHGRIEELITSIATIYAVNFSRDELGQLLAFYRTSAGQKFIEKMPTITQQSLTVGQKFGQQISGDLRNRMIEELRKRG